MPPASKCEGPDLSGPFLFALTAGWGCPIARSLRRSAISTLARTSVTAGFFATTWAGFVVLALPSPLPGRRTPNEPSPAVALAASGYRTLGSGFFARRPSIEGTPSAGIGAGGGIVIAPDAARRAAFRASVLGSTVGSSAP